MNMNERIARAISQSGKQRVEIAALCDVKPSSISQWTSGEIKSLKAESVFALAKATGFRAEWLALGKGPEREEEIDGVPRADDYALIPQYTARGASGRGYLNDHVEVKGGLAFKKDWLRRIGLKDGQLSVFYNSGDSNWPTLSDGEVLLLDESQSEPRSGKMYALLTADGEIIIKRLIRDITGGWIIRSDNQDKTRYPDQPVSDEGMRAVEVIGRVVWRGGGID
ncbi:repressor [Pseudomonas solani]|uniref:Repressor n=1 Tax=Pseudomonas solani TaxID=2731552 RepID=A0ABM7L2A1_9PSED|nr:LexA family transcriptional regulator [Pseudomonas solani]BCD83618.1 repressor [Pseudomonas solani]